MIQNPVILMWKCDGSRCFPASRSGSGGAGINAVDTGGAPGRAGRGRCSPDQNQGGVGWSRWCQRQRPRLMDGIISYTDESGGRPARHHPRSSSSSPQSHTILPPADIHHPVRAWWIVGDHWSEKIPLNSSHSIWRVTANSAHGNCGRPRSAAPQSPPPPRPRLHAPRRPARDGAIFHLFSHLLR